MRVLLLVTSLLTSSVAFSWPLLLASCGPAQDGGAQALEQLEQLEQAYDEGPRQAAERRAGTGRVDFPLSTKSAEAKAFFDQGLGLLHCGHAFEAERSFRQAAVLDPDCALTYWGMALANAANPDRAASFAWEAYARRDTASALERALIEAYARYFGATTEPPKAVRKAVRALRRSGLSAPSDTRLGALLTEYESILRAAPENVEVRALVARELCRARVTLRDSATGEPARESPRRSSPLELLEFVFGPANAQRLLVEDVVTKEPQHPAWRYRTMLAEPPFGRGLEEAALHCGPAAPAVGTMWHASGLAFARLGQHGAAMRAMDAAVRSDHAAMRRTRLFPYEVHGYMEHRAAYGTSLRRVGRLADAAKDARAMLALPRHPKHGDPAGAIAKGSLVASLLLAERWDELLAVSRDPFERGRAFAMTGRLDEARTELAAWKRDAHGVDPRATQLAHLIALREGKLESIDALDAAGYPRSQLATLVADAGLAKRALRLLPEVELPTAASLAQRIWITWRAGHEEDAARLFPALRKSAAYADLDAPPFRRLAEVAGALSLPADWRLAASEPRAMFAQLETLGPREWTPPEAPAFVLPKGPTGRMGLADLAGKPTLVVFFLGFGCVHCIEQLNELRPRAPAFRDAGIRIVTIGTDTLDQVRASMQNAIEADDDPMPFPVLCDPKGEVFKRYRCWDDFENTALHGTFLLDAKGRIRWQDISYEPFLETDFLLRECKRILEQQGPR